MRGDATGFGNRIRKNYAKEAFLLNFAGLFVSVFQWHVGCCQRRWGNDLRYFWDTSCG
jgi:hypothetical protein